MEFALDASQPPLLCFLSGLVMRRSQQQTVDCGDGVSALGTAFNQILSSAQTAAFYNLKLSAELLIMGAHGLWPNSS